MKTKIIAYFLLFFINTAVALSCYYYPVTRDQFFYLDKHNLINPFTEYYNAYLYSNPRINQFFTNIISRTKWVEVVFGIIIFNSFFSILFLNIYRRLPRFSEITDVGRFLIFTAFFIFLINYFGEMFYYTPFNTNYTLSHVFYLFYIFILTDYYQDKNEDFIGKFPPLFIIILGIYIGMSNEHIPPVLLAFSFFAAAFYTLKNKKLPNYKVITLNLSLFVGYLILFFAPANKVKEKMVNKSPFEISLKEYGYNIMTIFKSYYYYNAELIVLSVIVMILAVLYFKKIKTHQKIIGRILIYLALIVFSLAIVGLSPLIGTRLLFFSTILIIIVMYELIRRIINNLYVKKILSGMAFVWLLIFFSVSIFATFTANKNSERVLQEITKKSNSTKDVVLKQGFQYFIPELGKFNRKILLENGDVYIDKNPAHNTSQEQNIIYYYRIKSISHK
ncbi:DUF6056 family protein [Chryseobacterium sp. GMJ5]|uniref:DUF6056 family protein n=1 Tax=Chryseobacterium gilvum TaxID=2976534 RepID=A0ABT2VX95_9FLAO|nr:DUF6056 family protein [Chryseobacterium gilvum]MCU7614264.1 DUF6056 family protein [Chryseobacterium gilvum]